MNTASTADPPFALPAPITHVIDLPLPPSVNRIWRAQKAGKFAVSRSSEYRKWVIAADMMIMAHGGMRGRKTIYGPFSALIEVRRPGETSDLDNRIKAVLDYAQRLRFIENDQRCVEVTARWSDNAPTGCRLTLKAVT